MSAHLTRFLIAYDVADDQRRARLAKLLESFGDRIQYSVFIVDITAAQEMRLRAAVKMKIDSRADSILFCRLGSASSTGVERITYLGCQRGLTESDDFVV